MVTINYFIYGATYKKCIPRIRKIEFGTQTFIFVDDLYDGSIVLVWLVMEVRNINLFPHFFKCQRLTNMPDEYTIAEMIQMKIK